MPDRQRLTETLIDLIKIDSPTGEEDAIDAHLSGILAYLGGVVRHDDYGNLVATFPGSDGSGSQTPVMLSAHMDTVEPGRGIKPTLDADGETLRSDGTTILGGDCKAGIAIVLEGLTSAIEDGAPLRPLQVVFSRAEEGGLNGARNLNFSLVEAKSGMVFDGEGAVSRVCVGAPAQNIVQCHITGVAAHAGLEPENGVSALLVAANILTRLPLGRIDHETTSNIGLLEGGLKRNIIPERAYLDGELRSRDQAKLDNYTAEFRRAFDQVAAMYPKAEIELNIWSQYRAYSVPEKDPALADISRAVSSIGLTPTMETTGGGSDANVFFEHGIVALPVGIGVRDFHTTRETANLSEIYDAARVCQEYISLK
ncbi:MAG: M20/M25/M40 family metallo-hydrolase [Dehalococcoidia bacterium]|nr:M20/M25/M40 family metallo-hydrolase [Dehalococcoidia bacterium]